MIRPPSISGDTPDEKMEQIIAYLREIARAIMELQLR